ncbi:DUF975 family protein [uncultured Gemmiger sp.]|uniref:DUF975 family protein n=1 Tax=uncultured Gemmiger sp. TaxID=1623490 RepID=UPI0025D5A4A1|nr:DUF975 family protein [uncultured Gemmiger sp.]
MWTCSLLKQNARQALSGTYWRTFALCLLLAIVGVGDYSVTASYHFETEVDRLNTMFRGRVWTGEAAQADIWQQLAGIPAAVWSIVFVILLISVVIAVLWAAFVAAPLEVGRNRFFMENRQSPAPLRTVTTVFRTPYLNMVKVKFLVDLKIVLGLFLLVIPGIYWAYCYLMVPYLLAENPYMSTTRAMQLSREMMHGEKWHAFLLRLSFVGWVILGMLTLGIGLLFLEPYYQATMAELYAALRSKAFAMNLTDASELGGFVRH